MARPRPENENADPAVAAAIEELISDLSRLRARVDELRLPDREARQDLINHLMLASMAAMRLRFRGGDDDLIVEDR